MKCNEARRMVVPFVKKELSERDTERFLAHVESCPDCMDELDIYFTVYHALDVMDSGERHEYDFKKMLEEEIRASRRAIWKRKAANASRFVLVFFAEALMLLCLFVGVRMKQGTVGDSIFERALLRMHIERLNDAEENISETETDTEPVQTEETELSSAMTETAALAGMADTEAPDAASTDSTATDHEAAAATGGDQNAGE